MALQIQQKGFYDTRRYFQGKDNPDTPTPPRPAAASNIPPRGQLIAGAIVLALLVLGFVMLALPASKPVAGVAGPAKPPAAAHH